MELLQMLVIAFYSTDMIQLTGGREISLDIRQHASLSILLTLFITHRLDINWQNQMAS